MIIAPVLTWVRRNGATVVLEAGVNLVAPALIYNALHERWGEVPALLASSGPPIAWSLLGLVRHRRIDALSMIALTGIALSLIAMAGGGSARFLQLRERMVTAVIGLAFVGSAVIGRPLIGPLARATVARESAHALAEFDAHRRDSAVHRMITVMTWVWGLGLLSDFVISVLLIYSLSVAQYLIAGPILGYGTMGGLTLWTVLYRRHHARLRQGAGQI